MQASTPIRIRSKNWQALKAAYANEQQGKCGVCARLMDKQHLDYDPDTKAVRGVLCSACMDRLTWSENYEEQISDYKRRAKRFSSHKIEDKPLRVSAQERRDAKRRELLRRIEAEDAAFKRDHPALAQEP